MVPVQVVLNGRTMLAELPKHTNGYKPHQPGQCTGMCCRTLAHTALTCCQLSGRQPRVPEQADERGSGRAEPLTQTWSIPQGSSMPFGEKHKEGGPWSNAQTPSEDLLSAGCFRGLVKSPKFPQGAQSSRWKEGER